MFNLKKLINILIGQRKYIPVPVPVKNLRRVKPEVKVAWTPSESAGVISQKIIIMRDKNIMINRDLAPQTAAFSFSAMRDSEIAVTVAPFNGESYGDASEIRFKV